VSRGPRSLDRSRALAERARRLIPGGGHTYSKGEDQFPANAPPLIERGEGCWCWDPDGNRWLDYGMGLRAVILGHAYRPVVEAAKRELDRGSNFTRPSPLEGELAERMASLIPCAQMSKFAKNGSDVTSAATRLARAFTGRDLVAACRDNPFYSFDDWWIGRTAVAAGIPHVFSELTLTFEYNRIETLEALFAENPGRIACVIIEPIALEPPRAGFLQSVVELAHREGALVIFDEMISGFRFHLRGAQTMYGVTPDLATFGKAMANGFSVAALCGRADVMGLGGLEHDRERVFLLSATHGGETHALAAALTAIDEMEKHDVVAHVAALGRRLMQGVRAAAADAGLGGIVDCIGHEASPVIVCRDRAGQVSLPLRTLLLQELVERGILIPYIAISLAHGEAEIDATVAALREGLTVYARALDDGIERHLRGPVVKPVFRRYN
jgi:glutamate-1-semialdehyde 2,1-aminomutase